MGNYSSHSVWQQQVAARDMDIDFREKKQLGLAKHEHSIFYRTNSSHENSFLQSKLLIGKVFPKYFWLNMK